MERDEWMVSPDGSKVFKVPEENLRPVFDVINNLPFMGDNDSLIIAATYLLMVTVVLPNFMKDRKAYKLKNFIHFYNIFQIFYAVFTLYKGLLVGIPIMDLLSPVCHHKTTFNVERKIYQTNNAWWFMIAKITEMPETFVFLLRKKDNQVSFLHVYHHVSTFLMAWYIIKFILDDYTYITMILNSAVHVVMYLYYALSAYGPKIQKYLWWKKYITTIQIAQFFIFIVYIIMAKTSNCHYKPLIINVLFFNISLFIVLFYNFYKSSYNKSKKSNIEE